MVMVLAFMDQVITILVSFCLARGMDLENRKTEAKIFSLATGIRTNSSSKCYDGDIKKKI